MQSPWVVETRWPSPSPARPLPVDPAPLALLLIALGAGITLDIGVRGGAHNAIVAVGVVCVVAVLVTGRRIERAAARRLALVALAPAAFLALRTSPWLAVSNLAAITVLLVLAVSFSRSGSVRDTTPFAVVQRAAAATMRAPRGPALLRPAIPQSSRGLARHGSRIGLAVLTAVPILAVVIALLASADPVFKGMVVPHAHPQALVGHLALIAIFVVCTLGTAAAALGDARPEARPGRFGTLEIVVMLSLAVAVLALFAVAQLVALSDAGNRLVVEAGSTPAEYARSGFFQLCWATGIIVAFLAIVRGLAAPGVFDGAAVRALSGVVPLLAIGLVVVSVRRMALYDAAFGMTMLRLWVVGIAVWMGLLLAMFAARSVGIGGSRSWLLAGAGGTALVLIMVANVANPEAFVVHHNIARAERGHAFDPGYLVGLSDDAFPAVVGAMEHSRANDVRAALRQVISCGSPSTGVAALNLAASRADATRRQFCSSTRP
ncbi:MAG: hypothetical protein QOE62_3778 [Actinomycetota bacterium]|nr:hypothetical protein [Actinomycetota bacterium]